MPHENKNPVPATSKPRTCKCGKPVAAIAEGVIEIMGKEVKVKIPVCAEHSGTDFKFYKIGDEDAGQKAD